MQTLWKVETVLRVKYFRTWKAANDYAVKFESSKLIQANESEKCWYETKHKNCEHLK